ncbi:MAG TPA: flagellar biosynthesis protein FlhA [Sandaracinaceae bacterium LLY-WYZ-13_1]|nr:flagellar biosynthesis protein FlhA [Sandaracinaceae bacterium LLY-WYZ-13_1]
MATFARTALTRHTAEVALAAVVVAIVGMMIVPLPTWLLDVLIATNLSIALLLLSTSLFVRHALRFGAFPTILLVTTLYRLALNVSSTRLILLQADAGEVIDAFGEFVVRGNYVVGAVVFLILTIIQLVVIARGSERVAEVGARFTLDAMPGKQLAIDADLRAGLIDAEGAGARRRELERESQFYGAMDGAMKFAKGDAIAAIVIIAINLLGGLAVGVLMRDMDVGRALRVYGLLTIGDGLVSQIPALLISTAAGLVVTRVASEDERGTLGGDIGAQIFGDWRSLAVAALFAGLLAVVPGLPLVPFAILAALLGLVAWALWRRRPTPALDVRDVGAPRSGPLELRASPELAAALAADPRFSEDLGAAGTALYRALGVRLPAVAPEPTEARDDAYEIRLGAVPVDRGRCPRDRRFVTGEAEALREVDPDVELDGDGGWIAPDRAAAARERRMRPQTAAEVLAERLVRAVRRRPAALVGLEETQRELDRLAREAPALVRAVVPERLSLPRLAGLLRGLVEEGVSIRSLREILEAASLEPLPDDELALIETVRARLARPITHALVDDDGVLRAHAVDPEVEEAVREASAGGALALDPELARDVVASVRAAAEPGGTVVLTQPDVRRPLRQLLATELPNVPVLSYRELDPEVRLERIGVIGPGGP